jgi:hypothetical protein
MSESNLNFPHAGSSHQGNLLNHAIRRDIADLNRLFLAHALDPVHREDHWFQLPAPTVRQFEQAAPEALERAACTPLALFELSLPAPDEATPCWQVGAVGDAEWSSTNRSQSEARRSFGLVALGVVRRLAEGVPLASRIAFGLAPASESRLSVLSPSEVFRWASWQGLVRPRWPSHAHFWSLLAGAATGTGTDDLHWAYSTGLCLLGRCERDLAIVRSGAASRRPRSVHRRGGRDDPDVPC